MPPLIMIVEDESSQAEILRYNLKTAGFRTVVAGTGDEALFLINEEIPDLLILDWMLPGLSGLEVCKRLRRAPKTKEIPIIMLTARGEETDRIRGLDSGADDYVVKPFLPSEMVARVRAVLRRVSPNLGNQQRRYADIELDLVRHRVTRAGRRVHLGPTEFRLLSTLMERPGEVFSRERLLDQVWGRDIYVEERTVDVHIRRLRKALNKGGFEDVVRTVRGVGYSLDVEKS